MRKRILVLFLVAGLASGQRARAQAGIVCPPTQRTALQQAAIGVARAQPGWNLQSYQQETAFYLAEEAYRQQRAAPEK